MSNAAQSTANRRLAIEGELNIYTASEWKKRLHDLIEEGGDLELDLSTVQELDTAGLQLLIMAKKEASARSQRLLLSNHSQSVLEVFELCGVATFFGDPILLQPNAP
nr:STAS domain-containing protein [uncultured Pseudomonas sp.]